MNYKDVYTKPELVKFAKILIQLGISEYNFKKFHENKAEILGDANHLYNDLQLYKEIIPKSIQDEIGLDVNSLEQECSGYY